MRISGYKTGVYANYNYFTNVLNLDRLKEYGNPRYITLSLRVRPDADSGFMEKLMEDADRLYQVGNLYLLDVTSFKDLREICEREDMNEAKPSFVCSAFC